MNLYQSYICISISCYIKQGNEIMPKLCIKVSSSIRKGYEIMPELCMNASSCLMRPSCKTKNKEKRAYVTQGGLVVG